MSAWFSSDKPGSLESLQFQFCRRRLQCFRIFYLLVCVRACVHLCENELDGESSEGGRFHRTRHVFFYSFPHAAPHLQRTGEQPQLWLRFPPSGRFLRFMPVSQPPVRQMEDLPNSFHASTWQRANGKPLEGGLGVGGGDW